MLLPIAFVALMLPNGARAQSCACLATFVEAEASSAFSAPTEGVDAISRPVEDITSARPNLQDEVPPTPDEPLLWCDGSDDPRCQRDGESEVPELRVPAAACANASDRDDEVLPRCTHARDGRRTGPRGVSPRLERPPRG